MGSCVASALKVFIFYFSFLDVIPLSLQASLKSFMFGSLGSLAIMLYKLLRGQKLRRYFYFKIFLTIFY